MKKLMIAAAVAAMVGSGFAGDAPQVYDMTITVKTTQCSGKQGKDVCDGKVYYRSQVTKKIYGKFWGCECKTIACPDAYGDPEADNGFMFWVDKRAFHDAEMSWPKLQRVGKTGENVEGMFSLTLSDCAKEADGSLTVKESVWLDGAGYGTAKIYCEDGASSTDSYIKSMSGNVVGTWDAASESFTSGCKYCGTEENCTVFNFCPTCGDVDDEADKAVVFGSFTLRYNSSNTKALDKGKYIDEAYKFNKYVTAEFACIEAEASGDDDEKTPAEVAQEQYTKAKEALAAAQSDYATKAQAYTNLAEVANDGTASKFSSPYTSDGFKKLAQTRALGQAYDDAVKAETKAGEEIDTSKTGDDVKDAFEGYKTAYMALTIAEAAMNNAQKYGTKGQYDVAKTAYETDYKTLYGDAKSSDPDAKRGKYGVFTNAVAVVKSLGATSDETKKAIDALEPALVKYIDALEKRCVAEDAKNLWSEEAVLTHTAGELIRTANKLTDGGIKAKDVKTVEGTYSYDFTNADDAKGKAQTAVGTAEQNLKYAEIACTASGTVCK